MAGDGPEHAAGDIVAAALIGERDVEHGLSLRATCRAPDRSAPRSNRACRTLGDRRGAAASPINLAWLFAVHGACRSKPSRSAVSKVERAEARGRLRAWSRSPPTTATGR